MNREISNYIKQRGYEAILNDCENNIKNFKNHLIQVCNLARNTNLSTHIQMAKKVLRGSLLIYKSKEQVVIAFLKELFPVSQDVNGGKNV